MAADAPLPELLLDELAPLDELLLHPAAKTRLPIAAVAAIAYLPRKVFPPVPRPYGGRKPSIVAGSVHIMARQVVGKVTNRWTRRGWPVSARWLIRTDLGHLGRASVHNVKYVVVLLLLARPSTLPRAW